MGESDDSGTPTEWDGYTDYKQVSGRVASEIHEANAAAAFIQEYHQEGGEFTPRDVTQAASRLTSAALLLDEQLAHFGDDDDRYQEIVDKWRGDDGRIRQLQRTDFLRQRPPDWLNDFVRELHRAGLLLGYLKAGREEDVTDDGDADDAEVMAVIEEMTV